MHPPFFVVDHKIGPDIHHQSDSKPVVRRGAPTALILQPSVAGWPPIPLVCPKLDDSAFGQLPTGHTVFARPQLWIVPPPQSSLRHVIGRLLIRAGQRMILENRA